MKKIGLKISMYRFFLAVLLIGRAGSAFGLNISGGASETVCVSGYDSMGGGTCNRNPKLTIVTGGAFDQCLNLVVPEIPVSAKSVNLVLQASVSSGNAVGERWMDILFYPDVDCAGNSGSIINGYNDYEFVATPEILIGGGYRMAYFVPVINGKIYWKAVGSANTRSYNLKLIGYNE